MGILETSSHYHYSNSHRRPRPSDIMIEQDSCCLNTAFAGDALHHGSVVNGLPPSPASTPTMSSPKKRKSGPSPRRRVNFGPVETLAWIETTSELSEEDKQRRWFQVQELEGIKSKARQLCVQESKGVDLGPDESVRGMDVYFPSRQRHNRKFVDHVLEAYHYRCVGDSEHVRLLVERWSAKSRKRAEELAQQDFQELYNIPE